MCALITPWNFPAVIASWKIAPALACGNTAVVKPASQTPLTALALADLLMEAGLPEGTLSVVPGPGATTAMALVEDPRVAKISFTGSTEVGTTVMQAAATNITRVSLELGGKSANVVFDDADLDAAIVPSLWSVFDNTGQDCCARSRQFVQRGVYDEFVERFAAATDAIVVGEPLEESTQMGPLISAGPAADLARLPARSVWTRARGTSPAASVPDRRRLLPAPGGARRRRQRAGASPRRRSSGRSSA